MNKEQKIDAIVLTIILILLVIAPIGGMVYFNHQANTNEAIIKKNNQQIKQLKMQEQKRHKTLYKRQENLKQLDAKLQEATNKLIASQNVLMKKERGAISNERVDQAERLLAETTTRDLTFPNDLIFQSGKEPLTLEASYPSKFKLGQNNIPIVLHAFNTKNQEVGFCVLYFDPDHHVFNNYNYYAVTYDAKHSKGTDRKAYEIAKKKQQQKRIDQLKRQAKAQAEAKKRADAATKKNKTHSVKGKKAKK